MGLLWRCFEGQQVGLFWRCVEESRCVLVVDVLGKAGGSCNRTDM